MLVVALAEKNLRDREGGREGGKIHNGKEVTRMQKEKAKYVVIMESA